MLAGDVWCVRETGILNQEGFEECVVLKVTVETMVIFIYSPRGSYSRTGDGYDRWNRGMMEDCAQRPGNRLIILDDFNSKEISYLMDGT